MLVVHVLRECWRRVVDALWYNYLMPGIERRLFYGLHALLLFYRRYKPQEVRYKTLLLMRIDRLGDYCLMRNFLKPLRESYPDYEITFLCHADFSELVEACDHAYVDKLISANFLKYSLLRHPFYTLKVLYILARQSYEILISPIYGRTRERDDQIVCWINASTKIGSLGSRISTDWYQNATIHRLDRAYTIFLEARLERLFEFDRNREFFSQLLKKPLTDIKYHLDLPPLPKKNSSFSLLCKPYGVFFLGAFEPQRKWSLKSWVELALKISPDFQIVLCGSKREINEAQEIMLGFPKALNLVGQTTFIELLHVLSKASFIVSVETAIPHFAVALGLGPIFVIPNNNALVQFVPYPEYIQANYHVIYHPKVEALLAIPHGFGQCMEIYGCNRLDLRIYCPGFSEKVAEKMRAVDGRLVGDRSL
ncbi:glycosyltransferase family 9 protein [Helicobacter suis]|uniref:glycosyltransferase family 9 protein n=1 Tax=Helicobacter suis TaxID=104628 RepID=UPI0013D6C12A|nr:glycosyltransferase family 9 protein [Helicobacter suis]